MASKEIVVSEKEFSPIEKKVQSLKVVDEKSKVVAAGYLKQAKDVLKKVVDFKEKKTKPLNEALKVIRAETAPVELRLKAVIDSLTRSLTVYQTEETRIADEKAAKIAARVGEGKGKLKGETAMAQINELDTPSRVVATDAGVVGFRKQSRLEVFDETLLPREFLMPNLPAINNALKLGGEVPGARMVIDQIPVNR